MQEEREGECNCLVKLRSFQIENEISIYSEHEEEGWVNVRCPHNIHEEVIKIDFSELDKG